MDKNGTQIEPLTAQPIQVTLGGKNYTIRRASLYDIGAMNRYKREKIEKGDANADLDSIFFLLSELMKPWHQEMTPDFLAKSIPFENFQDVIDAMEKAGFKLPQTKKQQ